MTRTDPAISPGAPAQTPLYLHILVIALVVLPCVAVSQFAAHGEAAIIDDHLYAFCGWRIWQGGVMYLDVWDHKPPGIHWIDALGFALGGGRYAGIVALCAAAAITAQAFFLLVALSVYNRGTAALATILAALYMTHGLFYAGANRSETFLIPCELALILLYTRGFKRDRWPTWFAAGLFGGAAFVFKQTGVAAIGAAGLHTLVLLVARELSPRGAIRRAALILGGFVAVTAVTTTVLALRGAASEAWLAVFTFNRLLVAHDSGRWFDAVWWAGWFDRYAMSVLRLPLLMALAAVIHAALWRLRPGFRPPEIARRLPSAACPRYMTLFGIWFCLALAGAVTSPSSMCHHFLPTMPPLMLLGAYLINVLKTEIGLLRRFAQRAWVVAAFVILAYFASDAVYLQFQKAAKVYWDRRPRVENGRWTFDRTPGESVGEEIARVTRPDDTIQCWEYDPAVYLSARRPNAVRFLTAVFGRRLPPDSTTIDREFLDTLQKAPPKVIVLRAHTYRRLRGIGPAGQERQATPIGRWLNESYRRIPEITHGNLYVLMREDAGQRNAAD